MPLLPFAQAVGPHLENAARYCQALTARRSEIDANDVLQEGLLHALRDYHALHDPARFRPWLFRILTRTFLMERRKAWWRRWTGTGVLPHMPAMIGEPPEGAADLLAALSTLDARERSAVVLADLCGFSLDEIQFVQGDRSLSAVKSRVVRARGRLRAALEAPHSSRPHLAHSLNHLIDHETERARAALDARP